MLENREKRLVELSHETARLSEENELYLSRLKERNQTMERSELALNNLREKYAKVCEERDTFRNKFDIQIKEMGTSGFVFNLTINVIRIFICKCDCSTIATRRTTERATDSRTLARRFLHYQRFDFPR